jgi:hypothetical protein
MNYIIASFPRSGNHLVRYIVEYLTKRPTLGEGDFEWSRGIDGPVLNRLSLIEHKKPYVYTDPEPIAVKRHNIREDDFFPRNIGILYIKRDMIEAILRHGLHNHNIEGLLSPKNDCLDKLIKMYDGLDNDIKIFDNILDISFEELLFEPAKLRMILTEIVDFFELKKKTINIGWFVKNWDKHQEKCKLVFNEINHMEYEDSPTFWQDKLTIEQLNYVKERINNAY